MRNNLIPQLEHVEITDAVARNLETIQLMDTIADDSVVSDRQLNFIPAAWLNDVSGDFTDIDTADALAQTARRKLYSQVRGSGEEEFVHEQALFRFWQFKTGVRTYYVTEIHEEPKPHDLTISATISVHRPQYYHAELSEQLSPADSRVRKFGQRVLSGIITLSPYMYGIYPFVYAPPKPKQ